MLGTAIKGYKSTGDVKISEIYFHALTGRLPLTRETDFYTITLRMYKVLR